MQRLGKQGVKGYLEQDSPPQPATTLLPLEKAAVFIDNKKSTTNVGPNVHYLLGAKEARRFYTSLVVLIRGVNKGGLGWMEERFNQVAWADLDRALHSNPTCISFGCQSNVLVSEQPEGILLVFRTSWMTGAPTAAKGARHLHT
jgi:hypothetical protein